MSATMTIRMTETEKAVFQDTADFMGMSVSEWARKLMREAAEDYLDNKAWEEAYAEYLADPVTYSAEEIAAMYL